MERQLVTLHALSPRAADDELRGRLAAEVGGDVGEPDEAGMLEVAVEADSREAALERVRDAIAAAGVDDHLTFTSQTGTGYTPPGERAAAPDERPDDAEPPHLERGSPHDDAA